MNTLGYGLESTWDRASPWWLSSLLAPGNSFYSTNFSGGSSPSNGTIVSRFCGLAQFCTESIVRKLRRTETLFSSVVGGFSLHDLYVMVKWYVQIDGQARQELQCPAQHTCSALMNG